MPYKCIFYHKQAEIKKIGQKTKFEEAQSRFLITHPSWSTGFRITA